jgi:hypothetical protein
LIFTIEHLDALILAVARLLVRFDHIARFIVNADHCVM